MSTTVYQDLQSCSESHIIETTTLKLKGQTTVPHPQRNITNEKWWSSLRSISTDSLNSKDSTERENSYVHPLSNRLPSSSQSLALCTENLGSETGTDQSSIFSISSHYSKAEQSPPKTDNLVESPSSSETNYIKVESCRKLPPTLTTLRGSSSLQVRPHREGGRLVIKAFEAPKAHTYFQVERSNGRLRLYFFNDGSSASKFDIMELTDEENGELEIENDVFESEIIDEEPRIDEEGNCMYMNGNSYDAEVEIGIGNCQRLRRCNKKFCDWRNPLWVATS